MPEKRDRCREGEARKPQMPEVEECTLPGFIPAGKPTTGIESHIMVELPLSSMTIGVRVVCGRFVGEAFKQVKMFRQELPNF